MCSVGGQRVEEPADLRVGQDTGDVGLGDHADEGVPVDDEQAADLAGDHGPQDLVRVVVSTDGHRLTYGPEQDQWPENSFTGSYTASCISPIQSGSGTETLTWNDGTTSTWNWSSTVATNAAGQLVGTYDGEIVAGRYAGASLNNIVIEPNTDVTACFASPGLTQTIGTATWTFIGL